MFSRLDANIIMVVYIFFPGVDINWKSFEGETALLLACRRGKRDCVKKLLEEGADKNLPTNELISPLFEGSLFLISRHFKFSPI